ncbi:Exportin 7, partial [Rhizophlyctis rosea]
AFFSLIEAFTQEQFLFLKDISTDSFTYIVHACAEGVKAQENVSSLACAIIDNIASFVVRQTMLSKPISHTLFLRAEEQLQLFTLLMSRILDIVLLEDTTNNWSMTRPLLPLVLINRAYWEFYISTLVNGQLEGRREAVATALAKIMDGIELNLLPANKDRFTQSLLSFRREMQQMQITLILPPELRQSVDTL